MPADKAVQIDRRYYEATSNPWRNPFPNPADFNFNYKHLLEQGPVAKGDFTKKVAVVGGGIAGVCAARELVRSGFKVDLFEATGRLGGRHWSRQIGTGAEQQYTCFEMGAMRMPPFNGNSLLKYYLDEMGVTTERFPNPGYHEIDLGIYLEEGKFQAAAKTDPVPTTQAMLIWKANENNPSERLAAVGAKWQKFADVAHTSMSELYTNKPDADLGTPGWPQFWQDFVAYYDKFSFGDFVRDPVKSGAWGRWNASDKRFENFGGLGMSEEESALFYTIGGGDGSWGAFYDDNCLYPLRTFLFGYGSDLVLVQGNFTDGKYDPAPVESGLRDSKGNSFDYSPRFLGVESIWQSMFFNPLPESSVDQMSLYRLSQVHGDPKFRLFLRSKVDKIERLATDKIELGCSLLPDGKGGTVPGSTDDLKYDAVVLTQPAWSIQLNTRLIGFDDAALPNEVKQSLFEQHYESSCKVFVALKERYWADSSITKDEEKVPQLMVSDTFIHDVYGYALSGVKDPNGTAKNDPGALLVSYTWEDDANKFIDYAVSPYLDKARQDEGDALLVEKCLDELDRILKNAGRGKPGQHGIYPYVNWIRSKDLKPGETLAERNKDHFAVIHWETHPTIKTSGSLYRTHSRHQNYLQLAYNQNHSGDSGLYFAGEGFSVEGGWTEPALRMAIDALYHIAVNNKVDFHNTDFQNDHNALYPKWEAPATD